MLSRASIPGGVCVKSIAGFTWFCKKRARPLNEHLYKSYQFPSVDEHRVCLLCQRMSRNRALFAELKTLNKEMAHASKNSKTKCRHCEVGVSVTHFCNHGMEFPKGWMLSKHRHPCLSWQIDPLVVLQTKSTQKYRYLSRYQTTYLYNSCRTISNEPPKGEKKLPD